MKLELIGGAYSLDTHEIDVQTCINYYAQQAETGGQNALIPTDGLTVVYRADEAIVAMTTLSDGVLLVVSNQTVYRLENDTLVALGVIDDTRWATISDNGRTAIIATGNRLYAVDMTNYQLSIVVQEGINRCEFVDFLDGYFVFAHKDTGQYAWFDLYSTAYNALNFATAEALPDNIQWLGVVGRELWVIGTQSAEVMYNTGDKDLPFRRVGGAYLTLGTTAPYSVAKLGGSLLFIATSKLGGCQVVMTQGYQAQRVSTHAIEKVLAGADTSKAVAFAYQKSGHGFYVLTLPDVNKTFVFDVLTGLWHERADYQDGEVSRYRPCCHAYYQGHNLVGDYQDGRIYRLDSSSYQDDGKAVYRERTLPFLQHEQKRLSFLSFELVAISGEMILSWSDDFGRTWHDGRSTQARYHPHEITRLIWRRLGMGRQRAWRISTTSNKDSTLISAFLNIQGADR